jgi:glycosyltransferase involved in cell wall biosynthesis
VKAHLNRRTVISVCCLRPFRIGATEIFARELSKQLAELEWNSVLCFSDDPPEDVRRFLAAPNVSIETIPYPWDWNGHAAARLARIIRRYRPAILHLYFTGFVTPYPWMAKLLGCEKVYFTDQTSLPEGFIPGRAQAWKRAAVRVINAPIEQVISVSRFSLRAFICRDLLSRDRFRLIYNSVDVGRAEQGRANGAEFRRRFGIGRDRLVVGQVSALIPEKGLADLLVAARQVADAEERAHFVIAGEGSQRETLTRLAENLGLASRVTFTGVVRDPLSEGIYAACDVACQVSRWEEAFGYVIAEAMASSRPVVGTRVGGIPELVADGETGFLVEKGDTAAMADRILRLLRAPSLRQQMGEAGRQAAVARFDLKKNIADLIALYGIADARRDAKPAAESSPVAIL